MVLVQLLVKLRNLSRSRFNINFLPNDFQEYILKKINDEEIFFRLSKPRKSKLGDYKYNFQKKTHSISLNVDLSEIQFLITFIHELAHKKCYDKYNGSVASHGIEWKLIFVKLLKEAKSSLNFTQDQENTINQSIQSPRASSTKNTFIEEGQLSVSDLNPNDQFELIKGRKFQLIKKRRTRYLCTDLSNGKLYAVSGKALVEKVL